MSQSKKQSIFESVIQTLIGLATSILVQITIYPLMGIPVSFNQNLIITAVFFIVSLVRGYIVRRLFNKSKKVLAVAVGIAEKETRTHLFVINCEV